MSNRVSMSDVANKASVSLMTVSRVINHKGDVSSETRERILRIIQELDYRPSAIARSLATKQTRTIGLVIPDVSNPFFADITRGIETLAYAEGYHVFLCNTEEDPQREMAVIQSLEEKRVDGLILCSSRIEEKQLTDLLARLPAIVLINRRLNDHDDNGFQSVFLDDERSGLIATQHLINSGHLQIGYLAGPASSYSGQRRKKGYHTAMEIAGLAHSPEWIMHCPPTVNGGYLATHRLLTQYPNLTALFCHNDLVAVGALQACVELNRHVPEDLAIVGHDDIQLAGLVSPSLTTFRVRRHELGTQAVEALLEHMKNCPTGCNQIILQPELIIRQSAP
ncbi:MAG: LacI family transcriptional regulator [Chloroflexi bacterium HGW-Chloroflexi-10]|nr:MAG: LacI family transcriptional regulator [Chloroflexi bacterium HGW-Chloroflexi-10]